MGDNEATGSAPITGQLPDGQLPDARYFHKELKDLAEKWMEKMSKITGDYEKAIGNLKLVKDDLCDREKKPPKPPLAKYGLWLLIAVVVFGAILYLGYHPDLCKVSLDVRNLGFSVERCK